MSKETRTTLYKAALSDWEVCEKIGKGSQGKTAVFRIEKRNATYKEVNALKVITIIDEIGEYDRLSEQQQAAYQNELARRKEKAESELRLMHELWDVPEIVDFHEHKFVDWREGDRFGCDLLIRMDYLTCLRRSEGDLMATPEDAAAIGISVCKALSACHNHEKRIIHRDVKPENIFKKGDGYLLGDFGIAKALGSSDYASTFVCSKPYAAPEVLAGEKYSERADIYSLGVTLYEICNDGCLPFSESRYDKDISIEKRIEENLTTPPKNADDHLAGIILKACARDPKDRWQSVMDMQRALEDPNSTSPAVPGGGGGKKRWRLVPVVAAVAAVLCIAIAARGGRSSGDTENPPGLTDIPVSSLGTGTQSNNTPNTPEPQAPAQSQLPAKPENEPGTEDADTEVEPPAEADSNAEQSTQSEPEPQPQPEAAPVSVASVALNQSELSMKTGGSATLSANVSPANVDDRSVTWKSSDSSVVSVSGGVLTAQGDGTAVITASAGGKSAKCTVTVQTDWSEWRDALPDGISAQTETRTVYRYSDYHKETTTSDSQTAPFGYELDHRELVEKLIEEEVVDVAGHYEYRYGCWAGADGGHSYCNTTAEKYYGAPAKIVYTSWSPTQYVKTDKTWTCGEDDSGNHKHNGTGGWISSTSGRHIWPQYSADGSTQTVSSYYWEESRWVDTTYKTEYRTATGIRYHFYRMVLDYESPWDTDRPEERENRTIEEKMQYRYVITD